MTSEGGGGGSVGGCYRARTLASVASVGGFCVDTPSPDRAPRTGRPGPERRLEWRAAEIPGQDRSPDPGTVGSGTATAEPQNTAEAGDSATAQRRPASTSLSLSGVCLCVLTVEGDLHQRPAVSLSVRVRSVAIGTVCACAGVTWPVADAGGAVCGRCRCWFQLR